MMLYTHNFVVRLQLSKCKIFGILGPVGVRVIIFDETPKGTSKADFTRFEPLCVHIRSHVLSLGD